MTVDAGVIVHDGRPPSLLDDMDEDTLMAAVTAGAALAASAGDLWAALAAVSVTNTARPAIEILTGVALAPFAPDAD